MPGDYIYAMATSPRRQGNSETLLDRAIEGARGLGVEVVKDVLGVDPVSPCMGCNRCGETGECVQQDRMQEVYPSPCRRRRRYPGRPRLFHARLFSGQDAHRPLPEILVGEVRPEEASRGRRSKKKGACRYVYLSLRAGRTRDLYLCRTDLGVLLPRTGDNRLGEAGTVRTR